MLINELTPVLDSSLNDRQLPALGLCFLSSNPSNLLLSSPGRQITRDQITPSTSDNGTRTVVISITDPADLVLSLIRWDGAAARLVLLPASMSVALIKKFMAGLKPERAITDRPDLLELAEWEPVNLTSLVYPKHTLQKTEWFVPTSGTTQTPRLVQHSLYSLARTVKSVRNASSPMRWGLLYDPARFAGLQVVLQALLGSGELVVGKDSYSLNETMAHFSAQGVNAMSATPALWRKILLCDLTCESSVRWITLGGEIADQSVLNALREAWPKASLTHIYASTEAGVGFSVKDGLEGFPLSYLTEKRTDGCQLRISDEGCLLIRRPLEPWLDSGDLVEARGERVYFLGRQNGTINVGGNKVQPEEIEKTILDISDITAVRATGRRNPFLGQVVAVDVVCTTVEEDIIKKRILAHCYEKMDGYKVPASIRMVSELPLTDTGKMVRT